MCEQCCLYTDLKSPYDEEIHEVVIGIEEPEDDA